MYSNIFENLLDWNDDNFFIIKQAIYNITKNYSLVSRNIFRLKFNICKLEAQLQEERNLRMEYDKSSEDLKCSCFRLL